MKDVFLIGPKHSGKTSAGKALALLCARIFIDLDVLVTQRTGKTPRELYNQGPEIFRKEEADALAALVKSGRKERVIALGGGVIDNPRAISMLEDDAMLVYLDISADSAWRRIVNSGDLPPFLKTENPKETHCALHERRAAAYRRIARIIIEAERKTCEEIANEIFSRLSDSEKL